VGYKIDRIIYETNVIAIYGGMICQLFVKLHGNLWRICFHDYIYITIIIIIIIHQAIDIAGKQIMRI